MQLSPGGEGDVMMTEANDWTDYDWDLLKIPVYYWPKKISTPATTSTTEPTTTTTTTTPASPTKDAEFKIGVDSDREYKDRMKRIIKIHKKKTLKDLLMMAKVQFGLPEDFSLSNLRLRLYGHEFDLPGKPYFDIQVDKTLEHLGLDEAWLQAYLLEVPFMNVFM